MPRYVPTRLAKTFHPKTPGQQKYANEIITVGVWPHWEGGLRGPRGVSVSHGCEKVCLRIAALLYLPVPSEYVLFSRIFYQTRRSESWLGIVHGNFFFDDPGWKIQNSPSYSISTRPRYSHEDFRFIIRCHYSLTAHGKYLHTWLIIVAERYSVQRQYVRLSKFLRE